MQAGTITIEDLKSPSKEKFAKLVKVAGALDESNVDKLSKDIYELIEAHPKNLFLLFDLTDLEYMNSKTIGYFTDWHNKVTEGGGKIALSNAAANIKDTLDAVGLLDLVTIYPNLEEAKSKLFE